MASVQDVLTFWFGDGSETGEIADETRKRWFTKSAAFDNEVKETFGQLVARAEAGELDDWAETARGRLALIIVLDQFPRNIFRGTKDAFSGDNKAAELARGGASENSEGHRHDAELHPNLRVFMYMPLMHAEDLASQDKCVELFTALTKESPPLANNLDYAVRHRDIVAKWGRFPHRNATLGRETTAEETEFLKQPGSGF